MAVGALDVAKELLGFAQVLPQPSQVAAVAAEAPAQVPDHSAASRAGTRQRFAAPPHPVALHLRPLGLRGSVPGPLAQLPSSPPPVLEGEGFRLLTPPPAVGWAPNSVTAVENNRPAVPLRTEPLSPPSRREREGITGACRCCSVSWDL